MEVFEIGELKLYVNKEHRFGTDAIKLADFATSVGSDRRSARNRPKIICDLCTGCGIVPFLLLNKNAKKIYAVDINEEAITLLRESIKVNSLEKIIFPVHEDLKKITQIPAGSVDLVTMNPPYYRADDGFKREKQDTARHEILCTLDDAVRAATAMLKFGGRLAMCHIPERLADVICTLRKYNLEPKKLELLSNNRKEPWLILISAKKGGKPNIKIKFAIDNCE
ncbi:MAG: methyltransferase [Oscillospiraceae bacterium]|nr:methyltransferase [Oscillospiraceae bacterium]